MQVLWMKKDEKGLIVKSKATCAPPRAGTTGNLYGISTVRARVVNIYEGVGNLIVRGSSARSVALACLGFGSRLGFNCWSAVFFQAIHVICGQWIA